MTLILIIKTINKNSKLHILNINSKSPKNPLLKILTLKIKTPKLIKKDKKIIINKIIKIKLTVNIITIKILT